MTKIIAFIYVSFFVLVIMAPTQGKSAPTMCEFIAVEYQAALDRGDITEKEYWQLVKRCDKTNGLV